MSWGGTSWESVYLIEHLLRKLNTSLGTGQDNLMQIGKFLIFLVLFKGLSMLIGSQAIDLGMFFRTA